MEAFYSSAQMIDSPIIFSDLPKAKAIRNLNSDAAKHWCDNITEPPEASPVGGMRLVYGVLGANWHVHDLALHECRW